MAGRKPAGGKPKSYYANKYIEKNQQVFRFKVNRKTEPGLLDWLQSQDNLQGYIKQLVNEDMKRKQEGGVPDGKDV